MPKLYSSEAIRRVLVEHGFFQVSQKGSHAKFRKAGQPVLTVILLMKRKEIPVGTFRSILRQSQLRLGDFDKKRSI